VDRYLVHEKTRQGPATHALVVGVGDYPHLNGGTRPLSIYHDGMKQLTSPPVSARNFAEWLVCKYNNPARPLATVALLLSEQTQAQFFDHPRLNRRLPVEKAIYANTAEAIGNWKARGEQDAGNLLIFYFCGHGSANGPDMTLLMSDYGSDPNAPLECALDFRRFRLGMSRHLPRQQVYFVDACRASSDALIAAFGNAGRVPVHPGPEGAAEAPIYYATLAGEDAFGKPGEVSLFTGALLNGLNGAGSDDSEGDWRVTTTRLKEAIDYYVRQAITSGAERASVPPTDELTTFELHHLQGEPEVPVIVTCLPESENINAQLSCQGATVNRHRDACPEKWSLNLPAGDYHFQAEFSGDRRPKIEKHMWVRPVYRKIPLEVK
jgi:hypothetical protein